MGPGGENHLSLNYGRPADNTRFSESYGVAFQSTESSMTQYESLLLGGNSPSMTLRLARVSSDFLLLVRPGGTSEWNVVARYHRPDFPNQLQVGVVAYTDFAGADNLEPADHNGNMLIEYGRPDILARFDEVRFATPIVPESLKGVQLSDETLVTVPELLRVVGGD